MAKKKKTRRYTLGTKQRKEAYENYVKRYLEKQQSLERRGYSMASEMLSKEDYWRSRDLLVAEGQKININQTLVSQQAYEYSHEVAKTFRRVAKEFNLEWQNLTYTQIRKGQVDVTSINEELKQIHPEWDGYERANYITHEVFGSP